MQLALVLNGKFVVDDVTFLENFVRKEENPEAVAARLAEFLGQAGCCVRYGQRLIHVGQQNCACDSILVCKLAI